jgi:hypothetical protein
MIFLAPPRVPFGRACLHRAAVVAVAVAVLSACGCKGPRVVQTYPGPKRDPSEIARLYETPAAAVARIDHRPARGRDFFGRTTAYDLPPGRHEIQVVRPGNTVQSWTATFDYDFAAGREYGLRVIQLRRDDGSIVEWNPRLVDYQTAQELASPR